MTYYAIYKREIGSKYNRARVGTWVIAKKGTQKGTDIFKDYKFTAEQVEKWIAKNGDKYDYRVKETKNGIEVADENI